MALPSSISINVKLAPYPNTLEDKSCRRCGEKKSPPMKMPWCLPKNAEYSWICPRWVEVLAPVTKQVDESGQVFCVVSYLYQGEYGFDRKPEPWCECVRR
jgi:hypothetical protein